MAFAGVIPSLIKLCVNGGNNWHVQFFAHFESPLCHSRARCEIYDVWLKLWNLGEDDFETASKLAYCYAQKGDYPLALEFCEKSALRVSLDEREKMYSLYRLKIDLLLSAKRPASAFKLFKNALKMLGSSYARELKNSYFFASLSKESVISLKNVKRAF